MLIKGLQKDILSKDVYLAVYNSADINGVGEKKETSAGCLQEAEGAALGLPCMSVTRLTAAQRGTRQSTTASGSTHDPGLLLSENTLCEHVCV